MITVMAHNAIHIMSGGVRAAVCAIGIIENRLIQSYRLCLYTLYTSMFPSKSRSESTYIDSIYTLIELL